MPSGAIDVTLETVVSVSDPKAGVWVKDTDLSTKLEAQKARKTSVWSTVLLAYGSLGVIYGDIGTSVIYVFPAIFQDVDFSKSTPDRIETDIYGAISLIFWTISLVTLIKYIGVVLAANDTGEGGTVALYALLCRTLGISPFGTMKSLDFKQVLSLTSAAPTGPVRPKLGEHRFKENTKAKKKEEKEDKLQKKKPPPAPPLFRKSSGYHNLLILDGTRIIRWFRYNFIAQRCLLIITMLATGLIIGDGILMPAFSVVSAINGLRRETSINTDGEIVGISVAILVVLFFCQHIGTKKIGWLFSPIIIIWLLCNLGVGIYNLSHYGGSIFAGLSPHYIVLYFNAHPQAAWISLAGVLLGVTGTETMFAAMGHFSRGSIAMAFGLFTYPCLIITYLGQGAYLLENPLEVGTAFWSSIPHDFYWPMLVLATLAAVVASQAAITGTFSLLRQAMALGIFPRLRIVHTGDVVEGQIFIPVINYSLMALCIAVVAGFKGDNLLLADAYGVAVISVMLITTCLAILIMLTAWETSLLIVVPFACLFLLIEGGFLSSSLRKVPQGAWFAVVVSVTFASIMLVWWLGSLWRRRVVLANAKALTAAGMLHVSKSQRGVQAEKKLRTDETTVSVSAAGYDMYSSKKEVEMEDNFAVQLAATIAGGPMKANRDGGDLARFSQQGRASRLLPGYTPVTTDIRPSANSQRPILGRYSATPAPGRNTTSPALSSLARISSGHHKLVKQDDYNEGASARGRSGANHCAIPEGAALDTPEAELPNRTPSSGLGGDVPKGKLSSQLGGPSALGRTSAAAALGRTSEVPGVVFAKNEANVWENNTQTSMALQAHPDKPLSLLNRLGLYYSESPVGIPEVMRHFLRNVDALHEVAIFLTVRFLPMPVVTHSERLLVKAVYGVPNFYQVVARYGYQDVVEHGPSFLAHVKATILHRLEIKAGLRNKGVQDDNIHAVEDEDIQDEEEPSTHGGTAARSRSASAKHNESNPFGIPACLKEDEQWRATREAIAADIGVRGSKADLTDGMPMMCRFAEDAMDKLAEAAVAPEASQAVVDAYDMAITLVNAFDEGVVYYLGRTWTRSKAGSNPLQSFIVGTLFRTMELLAYHDSEAWQIPLDNMVELGMTVEV